MEIQLDNEDSKSFADYQTEAHLWVTLATGDYYPDVLEPVYDLYKLKGRDA